MHGISEGSRVALSTHTARPLCLTCKALRLLLLLGALLTGCAPLPASVQTFTHTHTLTQITNSTGGRLYSAPSINADGARIAFVSGDDLTPGSPGNADGNSEIFLATGAPPPSPPSPSGRR